MTIDKHYLRETLVHLIQIDSINPSLEPGARGEAEIAGYIAASLREVGLAVETREPEPGRITTIGRLPGTGGGKSLMLNAHCDTVGVAGMADPFSAAIEAGEDGRIYGRGSYDMKGSLAACMAAAKALLDAGVPLRGDVIVAAVADEEYGSLGTRDLLTALKTDGAIVTEPTALDVCLAHKGYLWIEVRVEGRAAHGSKFASGIDANMKMGRFLHALEMLERELRNRKPHPLVGPPSLHAATLQGGSGLSTYAAECVLRIERRTVPGETAEQAVEEIEEIAARLNAMDPDFQATVAPFFVREPFEVSKEAHIVQAVFQAATQVRGHAPKYIGDSPWMDAALLRAAGIETVVCGPAGAGAHSDIEWADLASITQLARILAEAAITYCA